jgi:hypothetical protein
VSNEQLREQVLLRSSLSNEIRRLYLALISDDHLRLRINDAISINMHLSDEGVAGCGPALDIRPYHTLLVLDSSAVDEEKLGHTVMGSSTVLRVLTSANPTIPLGNLALSMELPLEDLIQIVRHLVFWGVARLIHTITLDTVFQVVPSAPLHGDVTFDFDIAFPEFMELVLSDMSDNVADGSDGATMRAPTGLSHGMSYHSVLSLFDGHNTLDEVVARLPEPLGHFTVDVVVWLLRRGVIRDVEEFLVRIAPLPDDVLKDDPITNELAKRLEPYLQGDVSVRDMLWKSSLSHEEVDAFVASTRGAIVRHVRQSSLSLQGQGPS